MHRQTDPSIRVAIAQAAKSIRMRLVRQSATALGIMLGIAFYASVNMSAAVATGETEFQARLKWLALLSLLMVLVGITNSMLMSITERYKEIGTFKCLGATDRFIVKVFFLEALMLGTAASLIGALLGQTVIALVWFVQGDGISQAALSSAPRILGVSLLIGIGITAAAAVLPAYQAAKMPAAAALRVEI